MYTFHSSAVVTGVATTNTDSCTYWSNLAKRISADYSSNSFHSSCTDPPQNEKTCAKLNCSGEFRYKTGFSSNPLFQMEFCYGLTLNHCEPSIDYYLVVPDKNISFHDRVKSNTSIKVNGLSYSLFDGLGRAEVYLHFELVRRNSTVELAVKSKVKVVRGYKESWPEALQLTLVPETQIPIASCPPGKTDSPIPAHVPKTQCNAIETLQPVTTTTKSPTQKRTCDPASLAPQCRREEKCQQNSSGKGMCVCKVQYSLNSETGECENTVTTTTKASVPVETPTVISKPGVTSQTTKSHSKKTVIIAGTVGAVVLVVAIVVAVIVGVRKRRARTFRHHLLLDTDDTEVIM
ncbi:hypothetical protein ScPMuIL_002742 [Solemya velum]